MAKEQPDLFRIVGRDREIAAVRERLARLESERAELEASLNKLLSAQQARQSAPLDAPVTSASSPAAKIGLFRSLFRGRDDVFPKRWENPKIGKAGYAPACANEWVPRICGKPRVKCGDCPNRAFLPVTDEVPLMDICAGTIQSASIQFWRTRHAGFLPPISIRQLGEMTLLPSSRPARHAVFRQRLSAPAPVMAGMCGFSSLNLSRRLWHADWERIS
jgi:TOTE conflict system primase-like protein